MSDIVATGNTGHWSVPDAAARIDERAEVRSQALFQHGSLLVKYYAPRGTDKQTPHPRDELYVVASGRATFFNGTDRRPCIPADLLFAAAGVIHRFEDMSSDFATWVMFYGPEGGEAA
jgi:mannose-6-phosphate isomerase-like protein (cupin superfamily)